MYWISRAAVILHFLTRLGAWHMQLFTSYNDLIIVSVCLSIWLTVYSFCNLLCPMLM